MPDATSACPDLTTFARPGDLVVVVIGQRSEPRRAVLACRVVAEDRWCRHCGCVWRQDTTAAAPPRGKISRRGIKEALAGMACQHLSIARVAQGLAVAWNTANDAVLAEGDRVLVPDPRRFDGVRVLGVDGSPAYCAPAGAPPAAGVIRTGARDTSP